MTGAADIKSITEHLRKVLTDGRVDEALGMVETIPAQLRARKTELELQILKLRKHQFGQRSEKVDPDQLALFLAQAQAESKEIDAAMKAILEAAAPGPETPIPAPKPRPRQGHGRKQLPAHLPREEVVLAPAAAEKICATCGGERGADRRSRCRAGRTRGAALWRRSRPVTCAPRSRWSSSGSSRSSASPPKPAKTTRHGGSARRRRSSPRLAPPPPRRALPPNWAAARAAAAAA